MISTIKVHVQNMSNLHTITRTLQYLQKLQAPIACIVHMLHYSMYMYMQLGIQTAYSPMGMRLHVDVNVFMYIVDFMTGVFWLGWIISPSVQHTLVS